MFKKLIAILTAAILFTSCAFTEKIDKAKEKVNEVKKEVNDKIEDLLLPKERKMAKELGKNVLAAIQNEDVDALADMFCQYTVDEYGDDLKPEIQNLYDFIDGEIVSYGETDLLSHLEKSTEEYGAMIYAYGATIANVITDKGNKYEIGCRGYTIYKENPKLVGFVRLYVFDENKCEYVMENYDQKDIDDSMYSYQVGHLPEEKNE